jgi:hypothetical protein
VQVSGTGEFSFGISGEYSPGPYSDFATVPTTHANTDGEFRSIGVADLAAAIIGGRPHRASGALALHVLEAMEAIQQSADEGRRVTLTTTVDRPAMMPAGSVDGVFD